MDPKHAEQVRTNCFSNAASLLDVAERELDNEVPHICFHLSLLALEEVGKASMISMDTIATASGEEERQSKIIAFDDHIAKLFWALWGGVLTRTKISRDEIDQCKGLATSLHEQRLLSLYTNPDDLRPPSDLIDKSQVVNLIQLTRARLELEQSHLPLDGLDEDHLRNVKWMREAIQNQENRKQIFSEKSLEKLAEFGDGAAWMSWLRSLFDEHEAQLRELTEREFRRQTPSETEQFEPKYRLRIKLQSPSHSIRNNAFTEWNDKVEGTKLTKLGKKDSDDKFMKSELYADFILSKSIPPKGLWDYGLFQTNLLIVALNTSTLGLFALQSKRHIERYYESLHDTEANAEIRLSITPAVTVGWDDASLVVDQTEMRKAFPVYIFLLREHEKLDRFIREYTFAVTCFSRTDIHLRLEATAFEKFFEAFCAILLACDDWDGARDSLHTSALNQFPGSGEDSAIHQVLELADQFDRKAGQAPKLTLTEVVAMKMYVDVYVQMKADQYINHLRDTESLSEPPKHNEQENNNFKPE